MMPLRFDPMHMWRSRLLGALVPMLLAGLFIAATAAYWPDTAFLGTFGRMFDSLAPHLLVTMLGLAAVVFSLGARRLAYLAAVVAVLGGAGIALRHLSVAAPERTNANAAEAPGTAADPLRVIWFNVLFTNPITAEQLAAEITASDADLVVLSETRGLAPLCARLRPVYPHQIGCDDPEAELRLFSRLPLDLAQSERIDSARPGRILRSRIPLPGGRSLDVMAVHMSKPWFYGFVDIDRWYLLNRLDQLAGPVLVMGDFNTAPWSRPMLALYDTTGLRPPRRPVATWPAAAGGLGVPIDQMLVRGGATLAQLAPWGAELGSNHRGLLAEVTLAVPSHGRVGDTALR